MESKALVQRYQELQRYAGWSDADAARLGEIGDVLRPAFGDLADDFYDEINRHEHTRRVITGGGPQIARLKQTLCGWLDGLFSGRYDEEFVAIRFRVGVRHVEIGLEQVFANIALSRLRTSMIRRLRDVWGSEPDRLAAAIESLNKLLDLDLAIIGQAYQTEFNLRQQRSERLATIGQVAAGVAHELRNPLNTIKTSVYYLRHARSATPEKIREHLERIDRQVTSADRVITALSEFAKLPIPNQCPVTLVDVARRVLDNLALPATIETTIECPDTTPQALADPVQLEIVVSNLVRNACDAMPDGGRLTLAARAVPHGGEHDPASEPVGRGYVELTVADTGCGIPADQLERIMQPLCSTKPRGLGLGLALSRAIIDKHDGRLNVRSKLGAGTTFSVVLKTVAISHDE